MRIVTKKNFIEVYADPDMKILDGENIPVTYMALPAGSDVSTYTEITDEEADRIMNKRYERKSCLLNYK